MEEYLNTQYKEALEQEIRKTEEEFINLPVKEKDISDLNQNHLYSNDKENKKILRAKLKKLKRGIKI